MNAKKLTKEMTILFQGDSITDGGRNRNDDKNHVTGHGYVYLVAARLGADHPELGLKILNRGCSGNRVVDMYARWREDALNLKPNLISILVGINDAGSEFSRGCGVPFAKYEKVYRILLEESGEALTGVRFVLCEPFYAKHRVHGDYADALRQDVDVRRDIVARLAKEFDAVFVPLQDLFDQACTATGTEYWLWDGVHPTPAGHELIARAWLEAVMGAKT